MTPDRRTNSPKPFNNISALSFHSRLTTSHPKIPMVLRYKSQTNKVVSPVLRRVMATITTILENHLVYHAISSRWRCLLIFTIVWCISSFGTDETTSATCESISLFSLTNSLVDLLVIKLILTFPWKRNVLTQPTLFRYMKTHVCKVNAPYTHEYPKKNISHTTPCLLLMVKD